ncbi:MAG: electron transport complex subunit RsxC [Oscillospiraceae bacterium]|nr:electron transport complex subunit RsxC [Oscillospiraceae bacterium]
MPPFSVKTSGVKKNLRAGVSAPRNKNTAGLETVRIPAPRFVRIPMKMHIGEPCSPAVQVGDSVTVGQTVGSCGAELCVPIHASISGRVTEVGNIEMPDGSICTAVTIESDGQTRPFGGTAPPAPGTREDFIKAVRRSGLVGLGGAGFPTYAKLEIPAGKIDTLIVNAVECEPYITVDCRACIENPGDVLEGIALVRDFLKIKNAVIAIEDNKPGAIRSLAAEVQSKGADGVSLITLKSRYPQGAEKILVRSAAGRRLAPGQLPLDVGCLVINVSTVAFIARYMRTGRPLVSRTVTVSGPAIREPKNVRVPVGISISDVIDFCGGFSAEPYKIITGGPMTGLAVISADLPVLKQNSAIIALPEPKKIIPESACIRCGRCVRACPLKLRPTVIESLTKTGDAAALERSGAAICMECACCAYVCPAGKPLVQTMRLAKRMLSES